MVFLDYRRCDSALVFAETFGRERTWRARNTPSLASCTCLRADESRDRGWINGRLTEQMKKGGRNWTVERITKHAS